MSNIEIRPIEYSDVPVINRIRNASAKYLHDDRIFSEEKTLEWMQAYDPDWYAILLEGEMIGYFRISNHSKTNRNLYIGADIDEAHRGKGVGYRSYLIMMSKLFNERKLNKISLEVLGTNQVAFNLYSKLGFIEEGKRRQEIWRDGSWIDSIVMSISRKQFMIKNPGLVGSPCVGICTKGEEICTACGRTLDQISSWKNYDQQERVKQVEQILNS
jgi:RimJ/RimL family protein N-acetyltransferase